MMTRMMILCLRLAGTSNDDEDDVTVCEASRDE